MMADTRLAKTFAKTFAFTLIAGIVGPIFLIMYFVIGDDAGQSITWMLWTGAAITLLDLALALFFAVLITRNSERSAHLAVHGYPAVAEVTSLEETATEINGRRVIKFGLRVHGPRVPPFTVERRMTVPTIALGLLSQRVLAALVEPDTESFDIDWNLTQLYAGALPTTISCAEDGADYDLTGHAQALVQILDLLQRNGIPIDEGQLDLRSNPVVRAEVMDIARRYGKATATGGAAPRAAAAASSPDSAAGSAPHPAAMTAPAGRTVSERLSELDHLFAGGRVSRAEYDALRAKILDSV